MTLKQNKVAKLFGLSETYNLEVTPTGVHLCSLTSPTPIMTWTLAELRSFSLGKESIEVDIGKASGIGAGIYVFKTKSNKELFRAIEQSIHRQLHEQRNNPPPPPLPPLRPREKQPPPPAAAQQLFAPPAKDACGDVKSSGVSKDVGRKPTATENVYEASPFQQQQQQQCGPVDDEGSGRLECNVCTDIAAGAKIRSLECVRHMYIPQHFIINFILMRHVTVVNLELAYIQLEL